MEKYKLLLSLIPFMGAVDACTQCANETEIPEQDFCDFGTKAGGFSSVIQAKCQVRLTDDNLADFLAGSPVDVLQPDGSTAQQTIQECVTAGLVKMLAHCVIGQLNAGDKTRQKLSSCNTDEMDTITWVYKIDSKVFDKSGKYADCDAWNDFRANYKRRHLIFVTCEAPTEVHHALAGQYSLSDLDYIIPPDATKEIRMRSFSIEKVLKGLPCETLFPAYSNLNFPTP